MKKYDTENFDNVKKDEENNIEYYNRTMDLWIVQFAGHLQNKLRDKWEDSLFSDPNVDDVLSQSDNEKIYDNAIDYVKNYFKKFNREVLEKHKIEKTEEDFYKLITLNLKEYQYYTPEALKARTW